MSDPSKGCLAGIMFAAAAWLVIYAWWATSLWAIVVAVLLCILAILIGG